MGIHSIGIDVSEFNCMISIIIPTYNEEKYIGKSLKCFREKMTIPHEVIVCDDKSTDKTIEMAQPYADIIIEAQVSYGYFCEPKIIYEFF